MFQFLHLMRIFYFIFTVKEKSMEGLKGMGFRWCKFRTSKNNSMNSVIKIYYKELKN